MGTPAASLRIAKLVQVLVRAVAMLPVSFYRPVHGSCCSALGSRCYRPTVDVVKEVPLG